LRQAAADERYLLTRDHRLQAKTLPHGFLLLGDDDPVIQLNSVIVSLHLHIMTSEIFSRCSRCNSVCAQVDKADIAGEVFPYILKTQEIISQCLSCRRYYWKGTHYKRLLAKIRTAIPAGNIEGIWPSG